MLVRGERTHRQAEVAHDAVTIDDDERPGRVDVMGRPGMALVVPVRLDPDLRLAVQARAEADHTTTSEIIREALRRFLDVA